MRLRQAHGPSPLAACELAQVSGFLVACSMRQQGIIYVQEIILKSIEDALSENFVTIDIDSKNYHTTSEVGDWLSKRVSEYLS